MSRANLDTLPSEIRREIVAWLAPDGFERFGKDSLKAANLAHSCLHEWSPEFMFRDMTLIDVSPDNVSSLYRFATSSDSLEFRNYVKNIEVKMPPAIRWHFDAPERHTSFRHITLHRLAKFFGVQGPTQLSNEQQVYCNQYYHAMVYPFAESDRWFNLLCATRIYWRELLSKFPNLECVSVGTMERVHHPYPTYTNAFVAKYGNQVDLEINPAFLEDWTVNLAWASAVILEDVPKTVKSLRLSMANIDNLHHSSTVNRLLDVGYSMARYIPDWPVNFVTNVILDVTGPEGTHGPMDWVNGTGSAGGVSYWRTVLTSMTCLTHLDIRYDLCSRKLAFTELSESDLSGCLIAWLLSGISLGQLRTLCLRHFRVDKDSLAKIFAGQDTWPNLKTLILDELRLRMVAIPETPQNQEPEMTLEQENEAIQKKHVDFLRGKGWLYACQQITANLPNVEVIELTRLWSHVNDLPDHALTQLFAEELLQLPAVSNVCLIEEEILPPAVSNVCLIEEEILPPAEDPGTEEVTSEDGAADELPKALHDLIISNVSETESLN